MMAGTSTPEAGLYMNTAVGTTSGRGGLAAQNMSSNHFSAVIDQLLAISHRHSPDHGELRSLCIYLSRVIDNAISNNEVPSRSQDLPLLIKQLYQIKKDIHLLAAMMVLAISVKSACQNGWFSDGDCKVLNYLANEIARVFGNVPDSMTEPSSSFSGISTIISRFFPKMKIAHIFLSLEVKPGFDAYVGDFLISNNLKLSPGDTVRLFVVQTDNIETSSCLITPPKVAFLLNGKGVEKRSEPFVDTGPQLPTDLSNIMKFGPNLLQAVGEFNGDYIIAVASTSRLPSPDSNTLQDYEQCAPENVDADSEVIEGSSRIQLNCPISLKRIKIPVKGHLCKHIQCFDFHNYVDINSRRPSWRCPHCLQHVCFPDIRIDRKMVKVLQEVGPNVSGVMFCSDGSWNAVTESENAIHNSEDNTESRQPADVLNLTQTDDTMNAVPTRETEIHSSQMSTNPSNRGYSAYWAGLYLSTFDVGPSKVVTSEPTAGVSLTSAASVPEYFSPDRTVEAFNQSGYPSTSNQHGRFPLISGQTPTVQWSSMNAASQTLHTSSNLTATPRQNAAGFHDTNHQVPNMYRVSNHHQNAAGFQNPYQVPNMYGVSNASTLQTANFRLNRAMNQSSMQQQPSRPQSVHGMPMPMPTQQSLLVAEANRVAQMAIDRSTPDGHMVQMAIDRSTPDGHVVQMAIDRSTPDGRMPTPPVNYDDDPSWRPAARMRGALVGQAYDDFHNQMIVRPNLQPQPARPILNATEPAMMGIQARPVTHGQLMGSRVLPQDPSGMQ